MVDCNPHRMREVPRERGDLSTGLVAGAGFEPATSGL